MKWMALVLLASACSSSASMRGPRGPKRVVQDTPRWMTEKDDVRLEIVEKLLEGGDNMRSLHLLKEMRAEGVDRPEIDLYQGIAFRQQGMVEDAERLLLLSEKSMPKNGKVHAALCVLYADNDQREQAILRCERATELDEEDAAAWNNLGFLKMASDPEGSRTALRRAVDIEPTNGRYRNNLAYAQAAAGDHRAALKTFLTTGTPADAHYNVGTAFERAGNVPKALSYYERALVYDSNHVYADEAIRRLQPEPSTKTAIEPSEEM